MKAELKIALVGNPNSGKTSLFNVLTGLRQRVGNYPGVTVDRKSGSFKLSRNRAVTLIDLPGTYSLYPESEDEAIATRILQDKNHPDHPDLVVMVADATSLKRSLLLCTQVIDLKVPCVLALNMADLLEKNNTHIDIGRLSQGLGVPVVQISARRSEGIKELKNSISKRMALPDKAFFKLPGSLNEVLSDFQRDQKLPSTYAAWQLLLGKDEFFWGNQEDLDHFRERAKLQDHQGLISNEMAVRYDRIDMILADVVRQGPKPSRSFTERVDTALLHPVWGYVIFASILFLIFQAIFSWASVPMDWIDQGFAASGAWMESVLPEHFLSDLLVNGIWAGLGGIVIFVPQIAFLFLFISVLEDSGYMSRAVFLMDGVMRPFGFSGKSVIPLVGGMACAVPSIMMARTIPNRVERLITIMVTPLMSCSARIPVYVLLISIFVPDEHVASIFNLQGLVMAAMYLLGFLMALLVAWVIKKMMRYHSTGMFVTELPVYRAPRWKNALLDMYQKSRTFVIEAGKVIILISIVLWFLASYGPGDEMAEVEARYTAQIEMTESEEERDLLHNEMASEKLKVSYAGYIGRSLEPVIKPLGFDWKIGIALLTSFAAREVFVGTMATIYSAGEEAAEDEEGKFKGLRTKMLQERRPDGSPVYSLATALALLIFYAFAMQCMSTLAIVKRETGSWKLTLVMLAYMTGLAYVSAFITYQVFS